MKPWEKYQQNTAPSKPWEKYSQPQQQPQPTEAFPGLNYDKVVEETHPNISWADRAVVKNLSNNDEASINYLQKNHPDLQFKKDYDGRIISRARDGSEDVWRPIDPKGFDPADLTDLLGDAITAVGTTAGSAIGGIAGVGAGGIGAIPGAMAGGAVSSGAIDLLRQGLGQMVGLDQDFSGKDLAISTAVGGLSPALFGTGATATQAALKAAGKGGLNPFAGSVQGLGNLAKSTGRAFTPRSIGNKIPQNVDTSIESILKNSGVADDGIEALAAQARQILGDQSGYPMKNIINPLKRAILPELGEIGSGIQKKVIQAYANNPEKIENIARTGTRPVLKQAITKMKGAFASKKGEIGGKMTTTRDFIDSARKAVQQLNPNNPVAGRDLSINKRAIIEPFDELLANAKYQASQDPSPIYKEAVEEIQSVMGRFFSDGGGDTLSTEAAFNMKQKLKMIANLTKDNSSKLSFDTKAQVGKAAMEAMGVIDNELDRTLDAAKGIFSQAGVDPTKYFKDLADPNFSYASLIDEYSELIDAQNYVKPLLKNPDAAWRGLTNLPSKANIPKMEYIKQIDEMLGTNFSDTAYDVGAAKIFMDPSWLGVSSDGITSTSRQGAIESVGGTLGYVSGERIADGGPGKAKLMQAIGKAAGSFVGGPKALKFYMNTNRNMGRGERLLRDSGVLRPQMAPISGWQLMRDNQD